MAQDLLQSVDRRTAVDSLPCSIVNSRLDRGHLNRHSLLIKGHRLNLYNISLLSARNLTAVTDNLRKACYVSSEVCQPSCLQKLQHSPCSSALVSATMLDNAGEFYKKGARIPETGPSSSGMLIRRPCFLKRNISILQTRDRLTFARSPLLV